MNWSSAFYRKCILLYQTCPSLSTRHSNAIFPIHRYDEMAILSLLFPFCCCCKFIKIFKLLHYKHLYKKLTSESHIKNASESLDLMRFYSFRIYSIFLSFFFFEMHSEAEIGWISHRRIVYMSLSLFLASYIVQRLLSMHCIVCVMART